MGCAFKCSGERQLRATAREAVGGAASASLGARRSRPAARARPVRTLEWGPVIARPPLPPGPYLVLGLARSGVAAARALTGLGHRVVASDARRVADDVRDALLALGAELRDGEDSPDVLDGIATVVKSPGVPREAPLVAAALSRGITVIGELELGWRL